MKFGLNFYFTCITDIITKQYNKSEIHVQTLYKWDSEGSQMTYLNLYPNMKFVKGDVDDPVYVQ